jgi:hypothetical protein
MLLSGFFLNNFANSIKIATPLALSIDPGAVLSMKTNKSIGIATNTPVIEVTVIRTITKFDTGRMFKKSRINIVVKIRIIKT